MRARVRRLVRAGVAVVIWISDGGAIEGMFKAARGVVAWIGGPGACPDGVVVLASVMMMVWLQG